MLSLYHCPEARSMRALWIPEEMGLPFELHELDFSMASLRDPTFLAVPPWGGCPASSTGTPGSSNPAPSFNTWANTTTAKPIPADCYIELRAPERTDWLIWLHYAETMAVHGASLVQQRVFVGKENRSPWCRSWKASD